MNNPMQEELNKLFEKQYHCKDKTLEKIANMVDEGIRKLLNACDAKQYASAKIILPYLQADISALNIVIDDLQKANEEQNK